jgi:RNA 3'-terminal phosphate cyclase (ATP)
MNNRENDWLELDGAQGEGGGQVLRTALTLSMITATPFRIDRIRAGRGKPGLLRQHLASVRAAAEISGATVEGDEVGSSTLRFAPARIRGGNYRFAIGTAGSCALVLQTVLPALWFADSPSHIAVSGGTHNKAAPPAEFLIRTWQPLLAAMGVRQVIELKRHGFYPAGGGELVASVMPTLALQRMSLTDRGALQGLRAEALLAGLPEGIAHRELERVTARMPGVETSVRGIPSDEGPGNVLLIETAYADVTETFTSFGERGVTSEEVADRAIDLARIYLHSAAAASEHLADQLLLPMALAGGGEFTTVVASSHLVTNADTIRKFLPVDIQIEEMGAECVRVAIS